MSRAEIFDLEKSFGVKWDDSEVPEYYVTSGFSHGKIPVISADSKFGLMRWGLIPPWSKDWEDARKRRVQCLNAIGEEVETKPSFRSAVKAGRFCIIPVNGFFEWHHLKDEKYPHFIYPKKDNYFLLAGLYERWTNLAIDEVHDTFTILTTSANKRMEWIHNSKKRMPLILSEANAKLWIDNSVTFSEKKKLILPWDENLMTDHPISKLITSRKENSNTPAVLEKFDYPELAIS